MHPPLVHPLVAPATSLLTILIKGAQARDIRDLVIYTERSHLGIGDLRTDPRTLSGC